MRKVKTELICGFLGSGKTTWIQKILQNDLAEEYEKIVVLQCEVGEIDFDSDPFRCENITILNVEEQKQLNTELFEKLNQELQPDLILIEYNGTWPISDFLVMNLSHCCRLDQIVFCSDATLFDLYLQNMSGIITEQIHNANTVALNRVTENSAELKHIKSTVKKLNSRAKLIYQGTKVNSYLDRLLLGFNMREQIWKACALSTIILFCLYLIFVQLPTTFFSSAWSFFKSVNTVFLGILIQALPFMLIGVLVSSALQYFIPEERIISWFSKHPVLSFPAAALMGALFPICDCAMAPIASRMVRKGVPVPQAITFLLAAPAVNPVTILSTLYAFPGQTQYMVYRILLGIITALLVGGVLAVQKTKPEEIRKDGLEVSVCSNGCEVTSHYSGWLGKAEAVLSHAGLELFSMGRFIIIGALVSSTLQILLPSDVFHNVGGGVVLPLLLMIMASFVMSVCSTSNAFIGRSFLGAFPPTAVMGFIVMGPMLDLSNLFMLAAYFKKQFVIKLTATIFIIGFIVFVLFAKVI